MIRNKYVHVNSDPISPETSTLDVVTPITITSSVVTLLASIIPNPMVKSAVLRSLTLTIVALTLKNVALTKRKSVVIPITLQRIVVT